MEDIKVFEEGQHLIFRRVVFNSIINDDVKGQIEVLEKEKVYTK